MAHRKEILMTAEQQFNRDISKIWSKALSSWMAKMMKKFHQDMAEMGENDARAQWREEHGLVYVKEYTVAARFRAYSAKGAKLSESAKKTLAEQDRYYKELRKHSKADTAPTESPSRKVH